MQIEAVYKPNFDSNTKFPVLCCTIPAGIPDFVDGYIETHLELLGASHFGEVIRQRINH
jgi:hypothetical protein